MREYPYATVISKIPDLFEKIKTTGQPPKVNFDWLKTIGFKSSNDRRLIPILKAINFIDSKGNPTDKWLKFRADSGILAQGILEGYEELFNVYPDAWKRNKNELFDFFSTKTMAGNQVINKMVGTFIELCKIADFSKIDYSATPIIQGTDQEEINDIKVNSQKHIKNFDKGIVININIQLTVPETTDEKIYDKFFEALKKHLLTN